MATESASGHLPLILIEGVLFFGGALAFGWWQLRSVARDQAESRRKRAEEEARRASAEVAEVAEPARAAAETGGDPPPSASPSPPLP